MRALDLNQRVLEKLAHMTQLTAEIRALVAAEQPAELRSIDAALTPIDDLTHRLARQLTQVPIGTPRH